MGSRKKTRRYEASRRNGHYTPTQQTPTSSFIDKHPPSITKARRRLQFGRKPPKARGVPGAVDSYNTDETIQSQSLKDKEVFDKITVKAATAYHDLTSISRKRKNTGIRLKKELEFLLYDADHTVYPVRLRSTLHTLGSCNKNRKENVKVLNKSQKDMELSPSTSRQH